MHKGDCSLILSICLQKKKECVLQRLFPNKKIIEKWFLTNLKMHQIMPKILLLVKVRRKQFTSPDRTTSYHHLSPNTMLAKKVEKLDAVNTHFSRKKKVISLTNGWKSHINGCSTYLPITFEKPNSARA